MFLKAVFCYLYFVVIHKLDAIPKYWVLPSTCFSTTWKWLHGR